MEKSFTRTISAVLAGFIALGAVAGVHADTQANACREALAPVFVQAALDYRVPRQYLWRIAERESGFRPEVIDCRVFGKIGERGLMQLHPAYYPASTACNPRTAIRKGAQILRRNYEATGSWAGAIAAYNWGLTNYRSGKPMPDAVKRYVQFVMEGK